MNSLLCTRKPTKSMHVVKVSSRYFKIGSNTSNIWSPAIEFLSYDKVVSPHYLI